MPKRIPGWFNRHPNMFAFILVVLVFIWALVRIGDESDKRVEAEQRANQTINTKLGKEAKARVQIVCLVLTDGVDRDKAFIDALVEASKASPDPTETEAEKARREQATKLFFQRLEPSLRPIECNKFVKDPVRYLAELRRRTDLDETNSTTIPTTTTTVVRS